MSVQAEELIKKIKLEAKRTERSYGTSYDEPTSVLYNHLIDVRVLLNAHQIEKALDDVRKSVIWPEIVSFLLLAIIPVTVDFKDWFLSAGQWRLIVTAALIVSAYRTGKVMLLFFQGKLATKQRIMTELLDTEKKQN